MDYLTPDSKGLTPNPDLIGTKWVHFKRRHVYEITDFVWNSKTDCWDVEYQGLSVTYPMKFTREFSDFFGYRDGVLRYRPFP